MKLLGIKLLCIVLAMWIVSHRKKKEEMSDLKEWGLIFFYSLSFFFATIGLMSIIR